MELKVLIVLTLLLIQVDFGQSLEAVIGGQISSPRAGVVAVYDKDDSIFLMGGHDGVTELDEVLKFSLSSGLVEEVGSFPKVLGYGSAEIDNSGNIFYFGGFGTQNYLNEIWMLLPENRSAIQVGYLPLPRAQHCSVYDGNEFVYIFGGQAGFAFSDILKFSTITFETTLVATLPTNLYGASSAWLGSSAYMFGGVRNSYFTNTIAQYIPATNTVEVMSEGLQNELITSTAVARGTDAFIIGGYPAFGTLHQLTKFDSLQNEIETYNVTNFPEILDGTTAVYVSKSNSIYTFGGTDTSRLLDDIFVISLN